MKYLIGSILLCSFGCITVQDVENKRAIQHVVLCWLKEPGNAEHRNQIIEVSKTFRKIPGVLEVRVGRVIKSDRAIVDDSFDVGILVTVSDVERLQEYLNHPIHQNAKRDVLLPLMEKVLVYDF